MTKVLLYSGGMDSWLIDKLWKPDVKLCVNMHTKYSAQEIKNLPEDVIIEELDLSKWERPDAIIPLRNLYLVMLASNYGDEIYDIPKEDPISEPDNFEIDFGDDIDLEEEQTDDESLDDTQDTESEAYRISKLIEGL